MAMVRKLFKHFEWMDEEGVQPNEITFVCLLSACSHAGLVDEGMCCYASMSKVHMISPKLEHYTCMVDLLGCAGHLQEAENMTTMMPGKPYVAAHKALLGACTIHGNMEMGEHIAKKFFDWGLKMLWVICCYQTSMILLATGTSLIRLNSRERKEV
jgi:pentatricopeptide repeat protein